MIETTLIERPWGTEDLFVQNEPVTVKLLHVKSGQAFSLQYHKHRDEFWEVLSGNPEVTVGEDTLTGKPGQRFFIPAGTQHRVTASDNDVTILEIANGQFDESDIVRLEDKYGRT